jgi:peptidoglycan/LPS O-acetylase OafA/YrhL
MQSKQIVGLDLVRFAAAYLVVMFHLTYWIWAGGPDSTTPNAAKFSVRFDDLAMFRFGYVGVHIFFVLSGFVIAYSAHKATAWTFLRGRVVRLCPAVWIIAPITLAVLFAIQFATPYDLIDRFLRSITLFPFGPWVDGVYWTLPVEVMFYSVVLALLAIGRFRWIGSVMAMIGGISSCFWIAKRFGLDLTPNLPTGAAQIGNFNLRERIMQLSLIYYGCFFALGVYLWLSFCERITAVRMTWMGVFVIGCYLSIGSRPGFFLWSLAVLAIAISIQCNAQLGANPKINSVVRLLGLTTYPLYLLHDVVGAALIGRLVQLGVNPYSALVVSIAAVVVASIVIAAFVEPAIQKRMLAALTFKTSNYLRQSTEQVDAHGSPSF